MITKEQAINSPTFHVFNTYKKKCDTWRRNGLTQTWVTRPTHFRIPIKYGLYSYGQLTHREAEQFFVPTECPNCTSYKPTTVVNLPSGTFVL